ncbi:hypothetical protein [Spirosoma oryzicola]|uniref:hypothetical protein n=1 Tax=Spirosoma oryzicola TaxID=2898794 RepID=UPI001E658F28|nr:hypothetical protein [Spirosoma oryzicola]UHG92951.1 hypothetical protein LQ777_08620 [Spirosoma oryzicola]
MNISDIPSFDLYKKRLLELENRAVTYEEKEQINVLKTKFLSLSTISDRFNRVFTDKGWVSHESLSVPVMEKALRLHKEKGITQAEKYLIDYYNEDTIRIGITRLWGTEPFRDRLHIIKLAYADFICGRYHSCVPLLLMMIDGVVADSGNNLGFFSDKSEVVSWDSIAGHDSGLQALKTIYYKSRGTTNKNRISLPYRNGILHGRDLGFANQEVATKCWVLLFVVRDVLAAQKDQETRKEIYSKEVTKTLDDIQNDMDKITADLSEVINMDVFKRAPVVVGVDCPDSGSADNYVERSPERALVEFIELWKKKNYGGMALSIYKSDYYTKGQMAGRINKTFKEKDLISFKIISINDVSSCTVDIETIVNVSHKLNQPNEYTVKFRLLYCNKESTELIVNTKKEGQWKIVEDFYIIKMIGTSLEYL